VIRKKILLIEPALLWFIWGMTLQLSVFMLFAKIPLLSIIWVMLFVLLSLFWFLNIEEFLYDLKIKKQINSNKNYHNLYKLALIYIFLHIGFFVIQFQMGDVRIIQRFNSFLWSDFHGLLFSKKNISIFYYSQFIPFLLSIFIFFRIANNIYHLNDIKQNLFILYFKFFLFQVLFFPIGNMFIQHYVKMIYKKNSDIVNNKYF
jgi:hypothetical protein